MSDRNTETEATKEAAAAPRVRPARFFRTIVLCALAAAPAACGPRTTPEDQQGQVFRGTPDAATEEVEPIGTPDYAVDPGPDEPLPVPAYGIEAVPVPPGGEVVAMYAVEMPEPLPPQSQ